MVTLQTRKRKSGEITATPIGSPAQKKLKITQAQKQALIDNLQLEVTERARHLRAHYALQCADLRARIERRINRIPISLRNASMGELYQKYSAPVLKNVSVVPSAVKAPVIRKDPVEAPVARAPITKQDPVEEPRTKEAPVLNVAKKRVKTAAPRAVPPAVPTTTTTTTKTTTTKRKAEPPPPPVPPKSGVLKRSATTNKKVAVAEPAAGRRVLRKRK